jgi:beta-phosphoglucomutase
MTKKTLPTNWAVIFDLDGTIVDNSIEHEKAWIELGRRRNLPITGEYYRNNLHAHTNFDIAKILLGPGATLEEGQVLADEKENIYREAYRKVIKAVPGFHNFLNSLQQNRIPAAIASNAPDANVEMILVELKIKDRFQVVISESDVEHGKPHPDIFLMAADRLGLPIARCLIFEDATSGFLAAKAAGAPFVVMTGTHAKEELPFEAEGRLAVYEDFTGISVDDLASFLKNKH